MSLKLRTVNELSDILLSLVYTIQKVIMLIEVIEIACKKPVILYVLGKMMILSINIAMTEMHDCILKEPVTEYPKVNHQTTEQPIITSYCYSNIYFLFHF